ncbi:MAG: hypothetical protein LUD52_02480 [Opitutae bacterium]|nr:hypothetical protein [Opitutae bacterium]
MREIVATTNPPQFYLTTIHLATNPNPTTDPSHTTNPNLTTTNPNPTTNL